MAHASSLRFPSRTTETICDPAYDAICAPTYEQSVDGGVGTGNIREIARAGADTFVAGSAIFGQEDYRAVIDTMRAELARV